MKTLNGFIERLFSEMIEFYGDQWVRRYGDTDSGVWARVLQRKPVEALEFGLMFFYQSEHNFKTVVFTPLAFLDMCKGYTPPPLPRLTKQENGESQQVALVNIMRIHAKIMRNTQELKKARDEYREFMQNNKPADGKEIRKKILLAEISAHKQLIAELTESNCTAIADAYRLQLESKEREMEKHEIENKVNRV